MFQFTDEQKKFLNHAKAGNDVLVDACIGSGKTTSIQEACEMLHGRILYLTYNRRLLEEARKRITSTHTDVHTFHSFAGRMLTFVNVYAGSEREVIPQFIKKMRKIPKFDTVIVDEYQDLSEDLKDMLWHICRMSYNNYGFVPQFLIVGDKDQKISDNTNIDAVQEIKTLMEFLDSVHDKTHIEMQFTNCFRLNGQYAAEIGQAWGKSIIGLNNDCKIFDSNIRNCVSFLSKCEPEDILVLGNNMSWGSRVAIQNILEEEYPEKFNKNTVYSTVNDFDTNRRNIDASKCAIFTTFDAAKGLERKVCVICNFTPGYLSARLKHQTSRKVLKNLFLVAASRGKSYNIFCEDENNDNMLDIKHDIGSIGGAVPIDMRPLFIDDMYDHKIKEDIDDCIDCLDIEMIREPEDLLDVQVKAGMIDISMCQGIYAQASYFDNYDIDDVVGTTWNEQMAKGDLAVDLPHYERTWPLFKKVLYLVAATTGQVRYVTQIDKPFIDSKEQSIVIKRLEKLFDKYNEVQKYCHIVFKSCRSNKYSFGDLMIQGHAPVIKDDIPWDIRFCESLKTEYALQAALFAIALDQDYGMIYNIRDNALWKVKIKDKSEFLKKTLDCVMRHMLKSDLVITKDESIDLVYNKQLEKEAI